MADPLPFGDRWARLQQRILKQHPDVLGYPFARGSDLALPAEVLHLAAAPLNNVGDPFAASYAGPWSTHDFERDVLGWFADLWHAPDAWWGYITSGGTAGNRQGIKLGLAMHAGATVYYSAAAHYSVVKILGELRTAAVEVPIQPTGEMDYQALAQLVRASRDRPALVVANWGTTMTEARDDTATIIAILDEVGVPGRFLHVDAALDGPWAPLLGITPPLTLTAADSIACSGHKFLGLPEPCGIFLTHRVHRDRAARWVDYINDHDVTDAGSRSGHLPVWWAYQLDRLGKDGIRNLAVECLDVARYAEQKLQRAGWPATRNPAALTVCFPPPPPEIRARWWLSTDEQLGVTHIICVPGVTRDTIDRFVEHLHQLGSRGFDR